MKVQESSFYKMAKYMTLTVVVSALTAAAADDLVSYWTGANGGSGYAKWVDPGNWRDGKIPGLYRVKENGEWVTNGCAGCTAVFGKCNIADGRYVRLNGDGNSELLGIKNVRFTGEDCSAYTFTYYNGWQWHGGPLNIEPGGSIVVEAGVPTAPKFDDVCLGGQSVTAATTCILENNAATAMEIYNLRGPVSGSWAALRIQLMGTGDIKLVNSLDKPAANWWFVPVLTFAQSGGCFDLQCNLQNIYEFETLAGYGQQRMNIASGKTFFITDDATAYDPIVIRSSLRIGGDGTYKARSTGGVNVSAKVLSGQTFEVACNLANSSAAPSGVRITGEAGGVFKSTGGNSITGKVEVSGATYEFASAAQLGTGPEVWLAGNGRLKYTGAGEVVQKVVKLNGNGAIENAGGGALVFEGADSTANSAVLTLSSAVGASVGFSGDMSAKLSLADGATLSLHKSGSESVSIAVSDMTATGANTISVGDGVTATVSSLVQSGAATVNVVTTGSGTIRLSSFAAGFAPAWITINGKKGVIGADGSLVDRDTVADTEMIDAHGGVVPNLASAIVGITTANGPAGMNVTLGADSTTVLMLRQRQAVDPAMVDIGAVQTLSTAAVSVDAGAKPLTLGSVPGQGMIMPSGDSIEVEVNDVDGGLAVNAAVILAADKELAKTGAGTVEFAGGLSGTVRLFDGVMKIDGADSTSVELSGNGIFSSSGSPAGDLYMIVQDGCLELSGQIAGGDILVASNTTAGLVVDGAAVTGRLSIACAQEAKGFFQLKSGVFTESGNGVNVGKNGLCYNLISGGIYEGSMTGPTRLAYGNDEVFEVAGGLFEQEFVHATWNNSIAIGYSWGRGVLRITNGEVAPKGDITMPDIGNSGSGVITLDGPGAALTFPNGRGIHIGMNNNSSHENQQILNLNAGRLTASYVCTWKTWNNASQKRIINFNGGVYNYLGNDSPFGTPNSDWEWPVDHVTLFAGGATIETASQGATIKVPMCAPTGKGIKAVNWSSVGGLVPGSHAVLVEDATGAGYGGTVFAQTSEDGVLTNMFVTSAGCNYTEGQTTVRLRRKSGTSFQTIATFGCELETQTSGGFTKTGSGTLGFAVTNTYMGATVVRQGIMRLDADDVINASSELVLDGGTLDMNGHAQTFSGVWVSANGGNVINGVPQLSGLTVDCAAAAQRNYLRTTFPVSFAPGSELVLENIGAIASQSHSFTLVNFAGGIEGAVRPELSASTQALIPEKWSICYSGSRLRAVLDLGFVISIR